MPVDLAASFVTAVLGALARPPVQDAYRELKKLLLASPLEKDLERAYGQAWKRFYEALGSHVVLGPPQEHLLEGFARHEALLEASVQLSEQPFDSVSTEELCSAFLGLGFSGADEELFALLWERFHEGFLEGTAKDLRTYRELHFRLRQESREETLVALAAEIRDLLARPRSEGEAAVDWRADPEVKAYLRDLFDELLPLQLMGIGRKGSQGEDVPLSSVYTALDVQDRVEITWTLESYTLSCGLPIADPDRPALQYRLAAEHRSSDRSFEDGETHGRLLTALEAASLVPRLVVLGSAGSGKSTFARYLALCLAGEALGKAEANLEHLNRLEELRAGGDDSPHPRRLPWSHGPLLPLFVELRHFVRDPCFPAEGAKGKAEALLAHLAGDPTLGERSARREALRRALESPAGALVILDGLDETPAAEASRGRLREVITSLGRTYPSCRILVTSRPYAYEPESPWRLDGVGFSPTSLAPFDPPKVKAFVHGWYRSLELRKQVEKGGARARAKDLLRELEGGHTLQPLAERPLMLTMMVDLHASGGGRFEGGRAEIYEQSVGLLLDRWNELRDVPGARTVSEHLGLGVRRLRRALESLAYRVHRRERPGEGEEVGEGEAAAIGLGELWEELEDQRSETATGVDQRRVSDYLHQRSGILVGEGPKRFRFPHRSFQEYLAACHLLRVDFPARIGREVLGAQDLWREVFLLAAARVGQTPYMVWALLEAILPKPPPEELEPEDPRHGPALLAALAVEESRLWEEVESQHEDKLERVRRWAERAVELGALSPQDRAALGRVLGRLGDRRFGVGVRGGLPEIDWVEVEEGSFLSGVQDRDRLSFLDERPEESLSISAFELARYPVTNLQYQAFVEAGGYQRAGKDFWSEEGWNWRREQRIKGPGEDLPPNFLLPNHPRVGVSFWEAEAYCAWLRAESGEEVRLLTEEEWEKAARGTDGRLYPWGNEVRPGICNMDGIVGSTSAVGVFPASASPYGVHDLSGNVWEWCSSLMGSRRVVRGGSWVYLAWYVRAAARDANVPGFRVFNLGFRLARGQQVQA